MKLDIFKIKPCNLSAKESYEIIQKVKGKYSCTINKENYYIVRSYMQFSCHKQLYSRMVFIVLNLFSFILYTPTVLYLFFKFLFHGDFPKKKSVAIIPGKDILPIDVEVDVIHSNSISYSNMLLTKESVKYCFTSVLYKPFEFYFHYKNLLNISRYDYYRNDELRFLFVSNEYSFSSSFITGYFSSLGVSVINVQHGTKTHEITDAFSSYNKIYVWSEYFQKVLQNKYCSGNFTVRFSVGMKKLIDKSVNIFPKNTLVYFLQGHETKEMLSTLLTCLKDLKIQMNIEKVLVKAHPRFKKNLEHLNTLLDSDIKLASGLSEDYLIFSKYIGGSFSTILFEADLISRYSKNNQKDVVINDFDIASFSDQVQYSNIINMSEL